MITGAGGIRDKRVILRPVTLERFCFLKIRGAGGLSMLVGPRGKARLRFRMLGIRQRVTSLLAMLRQRHRANADQILRPPRIGGQARQRVTGTAAIQTPAPVLTPSKAFFHAAGCFVTKHRISIRLRERFRSR